MTRQAVATGFERFVDDAIDATAEAFSVARAVRGGVRGPGGALVDRLVKNSRALHRTVVGPELDAYRSQTLAQFEVVLDYVESDESIEVFADEVLAADVYVAALREDVAEERRREVRRSLLERQRRLGDAVEPLVASSEGAFWDAVRAELTEEEACALVEEQFTFTGPLVEYRDAFRFATSFEAADVVGGVGALLGGLPTVEVDYTDEALRAMRRAEEVVVSRTQSEVSRRY